VRKSRSIIAPIPFASGLGRGRSKKLWAISGRKQRIATWGEPSVAPACWSPLAIGALESLEHQYDTACSQQESLRRFRETSYSYVLLEIEIPARIRTGTPRTQNTDQDSPGTPSVSIHSSRGACQRRSWRVTIPTMN